MMMTVGMTAEEMTAMVESMGWEVLEDEQYEAFDGTTARSVTVWQGDHAVAVDLLHGAVDSLEFVPAWAV